MRNNLKDYTELWQLQDSITTAVNACGYGIWDLCPANGGFRLELSTHIEEEDISNLCCQQPLLPAAFDGRLRRRRQKRINVQLAAIIATVVKPGS